MKIIISLLMMLLPVLSFSQKQTLKGKYCELSEPTNIEYRFKDDKFEYFAKGDVANFYGKGRYKIKGDSIAFYFEILQNQSVVKYAGQLYANKENEFQIAVVEANSKKGLIGAKAKFYTTEGSLINENYLNEYGELDFKTEKHVEYVIISYIGQLDLKIKIDKSNNNHQYKVLWKASEYGVISGEVWKYEIIDIKKSGFKLKKDSKYFSYKKKCI